MWHAAKRTEMHAWGKVPFGGPRSKGRTLQFTLTHRMREEIHLAGFCEHDNELSGFINWGGGWEFLTTYKTARVWFWKRCVSTALSKHTCHSATVLKYYTLQQWSSRLAYPVRIFKVYKFVPPSLAHSSWQPQPTSSLPPNYVTNALLSRASGHDMSRFGFYL